jgi:phosphoribosylformimino-5-aminoimidazole carboxamide ribotide isomerase
VAGACPDRLEYMNTHDAAAEPSFEVIPVIDLMGGQVVHARRGDRAHYRPIRSSLCRSARIEDVVCGLLALHRFRHLYVADLDALLGGAPQLAAIDRARRAAGALELWIDAGIRRREDLAPIESRGTPVLASETLTGADLATLARGA